MTITHITDTFCIYLNHHQSMKYFLCMIASLAELIYFGTSNTEYRKKLSRHDNEYDFSINEGHHRSVVIHHFDACGEKRIPSAMFLFTC